MQQTNAQTSQNRDIIMIEADMIIEYLIDEFLAEHGYDLSQKTIEYYRYRLQSFERYLHSHNIQHPAQCTAKTIKKFFSHIKTDGMSWSTRNGTYTVLKLWFAWLATERHINSDIFASAQIKRPKRAKTVVRALSIDHAIAMIRAALADDSAYGIRDTAILVSLLTTGMRRCELVSLTVERVNLTTGWALVQGKNLNERALPLVPDCITVYERWLDVRPQTDDPAVFVTLHGKKNKPAYSAMEPDNVNDICIKYRKLAGIPDYISVSPHKWRHAYATALARGHDPFNLQQLMGHSHISTTAIYVDRDPEKQKQLAVDFLPKLFLTP